MTKRGKGFEDCLEICKNTIEKDLSEKLKTVVEAKFLPNDTGNEEIFKDYTDLMRFVDCDAIEILDYKENPDLLRIEQISEGKSRYFLKFDSLRSNCRVTHQPDFGDLFVCYESAKLIDYDSLVQYLVSFRSEYHFHEECCEMIFKRLYDLLNEGDELMVAALYTRRGGIDITPIRYTKGFVSEDVDKILNLSRFVRCGIKQ